MSKHRYRCIVEYTDEAYEDLNNLPEELLIECLDEIDALEDNLHHGKPLFNKNGKDLKGCFKIFFDKAQYRIIYTKSENKVLINNIAKNIRKAKILGIGKRDAQEIYNIVSERLKNLSTQVVIETEYNPEIESETK